MTAWRVIGVGSPFGNDDVGWRVVEELRRRADFEPDRVGMLTGDRPGAGLISMMEGAEYVLLVDAVLTDAPEQSPCFLDGRDLPASFSFVSSHGFGVPEALMLADSLGRLPARVDVCGVPVSVKIDANTMESGEKIDIQQVATAVVAHLNAHLTS